ncbi:unnamed protein product [Chrysoparadoxa australica]
MGRKGSGAKRGREEGSAAASTRSFTSPSIVPPETAGGKSVTATLSPSFLYKDIIFTVGDPFLTPRECSRWIEWGEVQGFERTQLTATRYNAHRDNGRISVHSPEVAAAIFERLKHFMPALGDRQPVCASPNIRLYKYCVGQSFGKHVDQSSRDDSTGAISEWTVLMYLNGGGKGTLTLTLLTCLCSLSRFALAYPLPSLIYALDEGDELAGGETIFYRGSYGGKVAVSFTPKKGAVLLHGHGERCLTHEGAMVTAGVKYLLRTDICYR